MDIISAYQLIGLDGWVVDSEQVQLEVPCVVEDCGDHVRIQVPLEDESAESCTVRVTFSE